MTSGTIFASRKLSFTDLLAAIVIFVNGAKGVSALQVSPARSCGPNGASTEGEIGPQPS